MYGDDFEDEKFQRELDLDDLNDPRNHISNVGTTAHAIAQGAHLDKDRSIISQSAGKDAAELTKGVIALTGETDTATVFDIYQDLKARIFNDTLALAGAESVVERFEGKEESAAPVRRQASRPSGGGGNNDAGSLVINSGKHKGKTLADAYAEDPDWFDWASQNLNNAFLKGKVNEFLNAA